MSDESQNLLTAALALAEAERLWLVERLMETLPPDTDEMTDDELYAELERRRADVEQGLVKPIPWSELRLEE